MNNRNSVEIEIDGFLNPSFPRAFQSVDEKLGGLQGSLTSMERNVRKMGTFDDLKKSTRAAGLEIQSYKSKITSLEESMTAQKQAGNKVNREQQKELRTLQNSLNLDFYPQT